MAEIKTKQTEADVTEFILSFADTELKRKDSFELIRIMRELTGEEPKMWGPSIIGFGKYHYKSDRSSQEGDWLKVGFSPRKAAISLYIFTGGEEQKLILANLGKFKMGKACIYIKKLDDIHQEELVKMIRSTIAFLSEKYGE
jgi:hypothetical protein